MIRPAIKRTADWDGRPVWDLAWMPADGTRLGQNAVHAAVVIAAADPDTTVDPANPAAVDVFFSGITGEGQPDFRQQRVVLGPQGAAVAVPLHGRVSVVGQPARELLVEAREVVYTP